MPPEGGHTAQLTAHTEFRITAWQKASFIRHENKLWYDGKVPSAIA